MNFIRRARKRARDRGASESGAALVEFAMLLPFLLLLVLGIVEFGFLLGQFNEVRHGAHEGARLAAVNDANLGDNTCNSMNLVGIIEVDFTDSANGKLGDQASVTVNATISSLSGLGLVEIFLPLNLSTTADFRLEQPSLFWDSSNQDRSPLGTPCP
jgi:hypothetical protein